jgi:hypothetical protein
LIFIRTTIPLRGKLYRVSEISGFRCGLIGVCGVRDVARHTLDTGYRRFGATYGSLLVSNSPRRVDCFSRDRNVSNELAIYVVQHPKRVKTLLKKKPTNASVVYLFFSHSFVPTYFCRHSTVIRVLDVKEYNELQYVYPSKIHFLKCVNQF